MLKNANWETSANMLGTFFRLLRANGFSRREAVRIVCALTGAVVTVTLKPRTVISQDTDTNIENILERILQGAAGEA